MTDLTPGALAIFCFGSVFMIIVIIFLVVVFLLSTYQASVEHPTEGEVK